MSFLAIRGLVRPTAEACIENLKHAIKNTDEVVALVPNTEEGIKFCTMVMELNNKAVAFAEDEPTDAEIEQRYTGRTEAMNRGRKPAATYKLILSTQRVLSLCLSSFGVVTRPDLLCDHVPIVPKREEYWMPNKECWPHFNDQYAIGYKDTLKSAWDFGEDVSSLLDKKLNFETALGENLDRNGIEVRFFEPTKYGLRR